MTLIRTIAVAVSAAVLTLTGIFAGTATAKPITPANGELSQSAVLSTECGQIDVTFTNTTKFLFVLGVQVVGGTQIGKLPIDGRNAGDPDTVTVTLPPDGPVTETTTVTYGTVEGAEQDWYLPFQTIVVEPCPPVATTTTTPPASTTTPPDTSTPDTTDPTTTEDSTPPATSVTSSTAGVHYDNCDEVRAAGNAPLLAGQPGYRSGLDSDSDGEGCEQTDVQLTGGDSDLAYTGTAPGLYVALGVLLLAAGGGVLLLARRRAGR